MYLGIMRIVVNKSGQCELVQITRYFETRQISDLQQKDLHRSMKRFAYFGRKTTKATNQMIWQSPIGQI